MRVRPIRSEFSGREKDVMRSWRAKLVFMLVVYFAGFATAIYCLAPAPEESKRGFGRNSRRSVSSSFDSEEVARSFNSGMHKALGFGKEMAIRTGEFIKQKVEERRADS